MGNVSSQLRVDASLYSQHSTACIRQQRQQQKETKHNLMADALGNVMTKVCQNFVQAPCDEV